MDTATRQELISAQMNVKDLCAYLKADSLRFLSVEDLKRAYGSDRFCFSCFTGDYVTQLYGHQSQLE